MKLKLLESLLFLENHFVVENQLERYLEISSQELKKLLKELDQKLKERESALTLTWRDGKVGLEPQKDVIEALSFVYEKIQKKRFTHSALEVLGIIAFKQPITKLAIDQIRQADCSYHLKNLLLEDYIKIVGKKEGIGNATLYGTTEKFLYYFGLESLQSLPNIEDFKNLYTEKPLSDRIIK